MAQNPGQPVYRVNARQAQAQGQAQTQTQAQAQAQAQTQAQVASQLGSMLAQVGLKTTKMVSQGLQDASKMPREGLKMS